MRTINELRTIIDGGAHDDISDRQCRKHGLKRGSIVSYLDPYHVIYEPSRYGGYDNSHVRALFLDRHPRRD